VTFERWDLGVKEGNKWRFELPRVILPCERSGFADAIASSPKGAPMQQEHKTSRGRTTSLKG
jgi:hypothetical protein